MTLFTEISKPIEIGLEKFGYEKKIEVKKEEKNFKKEIKKPETKVKKEPKKTEIKVIHTVDGSNYFLRLDFSYLILTSFGEK